MFDPNTALCETRTSGRDYATIASFRVTESIRVLDLTKIKKMSIPSIFDEDNRHNRSPVMFLQKFAENISQPRSNKNIDIEYAAKVGSEVVNINAINSYIETLVNSRAMSNENVIKVLKAVVGTYNTGIKTEMQKETRTIKAQTTVTFSPVTTIIESVVTVTATVDGVEYTIPNVQLRKAGATVVSESSESHAGHDHGHGDNSNSGGGAGGR